MENSRASSEDWPSTHACSGGLWVSWQLLLIIIIDARECTARKKKIEAKDRAEELKMADGTVVRTKG